MAGHSQFKNIMHRKGAQDAKRAKMFTKIGREITVATKLGGGDPSANPRLRAAMITARQANMPNDRIKRCIDAGLGVGDTSDYQDIRYEGYGPGGVAIIVEALTDNRNRTAGEVRSTFTKYNGNLGESGSVSFMFDRVGQILYPVKVASNDAMFEAAVEASAENVETNDEYHEILTSPDLFSSMRDVLEEKFGAAEKAGLTWKPNITTAIDIDTARDLMKLIEMLEDSDDVQAVITNFDVTDEVMQALAG
jgi:YebC/PmpR family DNA-binding regulatory protein